VLLGPDLELSSTDRNEYKIRFMATQTVEDSSRSSKKHYCREVIETIEFRIW
jgi:hypothetical protein